MPRYVFLIGFPITINKPEILNCILVERLEKINKTVSFVFPCPLTIVKSYENKYQNYFLKVITDVAEKWTEYSTGKMIHFQYCEEYTVNIL